MHVIFDILNLSAAACYAAIAALFIYHLVNCWQRIVPSPVPAIATATPTIDLPTSLPVPKIAPTVIVAPEPTPIADVATASTINHRRQASPAKGFGNKSTQTKQRSKRQPVTA